MKFAVIVLALFVCAILESTTGQCPPSSQMLSCSPKCKVDSDCTPGTKCCLNICNEKSCSQPNANKNSGGYKSGSGSGSGNYCGSSKCNSYQKCELDRTTKKYRCV